MTLLRDIAGELAGMFFADIRLAGAVLLLVSVVATVVRILGAPPLIGGAVLLIGCHAILVEAVVREARRRRSS